MNKYIFAFQKETINRGQRWCEISVPGEVQNSGGKSPKQSHLISKSDSSGPAWKMRNKQIVFRVPFQPE